MNHICSQILFLSIIKTDYFQICLKQILKNFRHQILPAVCLRFCWRRRWSYWPRERTKLSKPSVWFVLPCLNSRNWRCPRTDRSPLTAAWRSWRRRTSGPELLCSRTRSSFGLRELELPEKLNWKIIFLFGLVQFESNNVNRRNFFWLWWLIQITSNGLLHLSLHYHFVF